MIKRFVFIILLFFSVNSYSQDNTNDNRINNNTETENTIKKTKNGWDYYSEGRYRESIAALELEKKYFPERINIYVIMGWCYRELRDFSNMEMISLEGLKIQPTDSRVHRNLAEAYFFQEKYNLAIGAFENYLKYKYTPASDPYLSTLYYYLGICYYNTNQFRKADISLSLANFLKKNNQEVIYYLALTKEKLKEYKKSFDLYSLLLKINPNHQKGIEGLERIKTNL